MSLADTARVESSVGKRSSSSISIAGAVRGALDSATRCDNEK
jgi:hypothetical protein